VTENTKLEGSPEKSEAATIGRNEPCPCGSGKKYKRCHGVAAAPKLTPPKNVAPPAGMPAGNPFEGMDPAMMSQFAQALQKLPRGQMQRLQAIMQKAMAGRDVSREAADFERTLPPEFQQLMGSFMASQAGAAGLPAAALGAPAEPAPEMTEEEARKIVAQAAEQGKISQDKAEELLHAPAGGDGKPVDADDKAAKTAGGISRLWRGITGKP
jgi:hypothetical protein